MVFKNSTKLGLHSLKEGREQELGMPIFKKVLQAIRMGDHEVKREDTALCNYFFWHLSDTQVPKTFFKTAGSNSSLLTEHNTFSDKTSDMISEWF